jgi:hypothetical protein
LAYLRYLISYDRRERLGLDSTRIVAADETWKARFWPNDVLKWSDLTINIGLLKEEHLGGESPTSFYTKVIMAAFQLFKINPEKFVAKNLNDKMLKARKKGLGIHDSPSVEAVDDIPEESLDDDTAPDNGGIETSTVEEETN